MRYPPRHVAGNLIWTLEGEVWAVWRVEATTYPWLARRGKIGLHARTRGALKSLSVESTLVSVCEPVCAAEVVERMVAGVDLGRQPGWRDAAASTLERLEGRWLWRRRHYIAVPLQGRATAGQTLKAAMSKAFSQANAMFGVSVPPPLKAEKDRRRQEASRVGEQLGQFLQVAPASTQEISWLYARAGRRGVSDIPVVAMAMHTELGAAQLRALEEGAFYEERHHVRAETEAGASYQAFLAMSDMPRHFVFPDGAEYLWRADQMVFPVDWCARVRPRSNADAQAKTKRQARQLAGQVDEWFGESAGVPESLKAAIEGIEDERAQLAASSAEPELEVSVVFCVWGADAETANTRAQLLRNAYEVNEYGLPRPTGGQADLYLASLPGQPLPSVCEHYAQFLLPRDLAAGMPFAGSELGDPDGMLLGLGLDGGAVRPVLFNPSRGPTIGKSGSIGIFGELGSGKSYLCKLLLWAAVARGGRVVTLDRTTMAEYVRLLEVMPAGKRSQLVQLEASADICLDPLRVFTGDAREKYTMGFANLLCRLAPGEVEWLALSEAVQKVVARSSACMTDVVEELEERGRSDSAASIVARKLRAYARTPLGRLVFGEGVPLELDADYICFHTPGLQLPDKDVLEQEHLARNLLPEQMMSQALLYLVAGVAKTFIFADRRRFAAALFDEAWAITASMEGRDLLHTAVRDGRKHNAAVWLASQHPGDIGDERTESLLRNRFVFHHDGAAAELGLRFLGMDATEEAVERLSGRSEEGAIDKAQCFYRDLDGRLGLVEILPAPLAALHDRFDTNPPDGSGPEDPDSADDEVLVTGA